MILKGKHIKQVVHLAMNNLRFVLSVARGELDARTISINIKHSESRKLRETRTWRR